MFKENKTVPTLLIGIPSLPTLKENLAGINKPGRCPAIIPNIHIFCGKFCSSDASCPGTQRCWATSCSNVNSQKEVSLVPGLGGSDDCDWPLTEKCCFTRCSRGCLPSAPEPEAKRAPLSPLLQSEVTGASSQKTRAAAQSSCNASTMKRRRRSASHLSTAAVRATATTFRPGSCVKKPVGKSAKVCKLPADPGHCLAYLEQYYYNWNTRKCETFVYGMCNGNGNHFTTKLECQMVCGEFGKEQERT
ncbi:hypothetical protein E2320_009402 [Naja naja]|nr:hypothetical protein E2320_009402 [Naja naja]